MSNRLINAAFKAVMAPSQKFVLVALCDYANEVGECFPSVSMMMERCCMSDRSIQRAIVQLVGDGYLTRDFRRGRSTVYTVTDPQSWPVEPPTQCHPDTVSPRHSVTPPPTQCHPDTASPPTQCHPTPDTMSGAPDTVSPITTTYPPSNHLSVGGAGEAEAEKGEEPINVAGAVDQAVEAMIKAGVAPERISRNNPDFHDLIAAGHLPDEFGRAAAYAIERRKTDGAFEYAVGIVKRRAIEAARAPPVPVAAAIRPSKPSITDSFKGKSYVGTAPEHLAPEFREALGLTG